MASDFCEFLAIITASKPYIMPYISAGIPF